MGGMNRAATVRERTHNGEAIQQATASLRARLGLLLDLGAMQHQTVRRV